MRQSYYSTNHGRTYWKHQIEIEWPKGIKVVLPTDQYAFAHILCKTGASSHNYKNIMLFFSIKLFYPQKNDYGKWTTMVILVSKQTTVEIFIKLHDAVLIP